MTAVLRTNKYFNFVVSNREEDVNDYFMKVEAQNWQLKHYLNYRLKNESIILPWLTVYEDWKRSLGIIKNNTYKKVPGCISGFCNELLNIYNTFEGSIVLKSCEQWYDTFYERNFDLQLAERIKELEKSILDVEKDIFSSQKMTNLLQNIRKREIRENTNDTSMSPTKEVATFPEAVQTSSSLQANDQEDQELDDAEIDKIITNKVSALLFSNLNLEEIWIKSLNTSRSIESRIVDLSVWTKIEWNRILKASDYSQLFIKSRKKLSKDKINNDVQELLHYGTGRIRSLNDLITWKNKFVNLKTSSEDSQLIIEIVDFFHRCLRREINVLIMQHRERDFIVKILGQIISTLLEEFDIGTFELNWIEKESRSVANRKRKDVHEEYVTLTPEMKKMDLIISLRSHQAELLPLEVGNTSGPMDDTKYRKDHSKLKVVMKDCLDTLWGKLHFKKIELEEVFALGIQITGIRWTIYSLSYDNSQNFYFFVEMATLILPTTFSDMEDLLPDFLENLLALRHTLIDLVKKIRTIAQKRLNTPSPPSSPLHSTTDSPPSVKKQKQDPFGILDNL
ncbi:7205_t:CDS:2, partial [Funneliformis geosporum]